MTDENKITITKAIKSGSVSELLSVVDGFLIDGTVYQVHSVPLEAFRSDQPTKTSQNEYTATINSALQTLLAAFYQRVPPDEVTNLSDNELNRVLRALNREIFSSNNWTRVRTAFFRIKGYKYPPQQNKNPHRR